MGERIATTTGMMWHDVTGDVVVGDTNDVKGAVAWGICDQNLKNFHRPGAEKRWSGGGGQQNGPNLIDWLMAWLAV